MKKTLVFMLLVTLLACVQVACIQEPPSQAPNVQGKSGEATSPQRIVSMAPSVTEILFALGLGDRVVGVTQYCQFPPETASKARIGGYFNPSYEAILNLKPDLVICLNEHQAEKLEIQKLGIPLLELNHRSVQNIMESIAVTGGRCNVQDEAAQLVASLESRMMDIQKLTADLPKQRVLVSIGRNMGTATLKDVHVAGPATIYNELMELAGGVNVVTEKRRAYPILSAEGMMNLNPQVILDMVTEVDEKQKLELAAEWRVLGDEVEAVSQNRIHVLSGDYVTVPGPRFIQLLEDMLEAIHPNLRRDVN